MFVVSFKKLINEEINFSPRLRTVHFRGTGHPLNRDYQDFRNTAETSSTYRFRSLRFENSRNVSREGDARDCTDLHPPPSMASPPFSTVHPLKSVCAFRSSVHLPPAIRYSLPLSTIHPSFPPRATYRHSPTPRHASRTVCSRIYSRPNSRYNADRTKRANSGGPTLAQRAGENAESFGLRQPNETKRNGTLGLFNFHVRPPGNHVGRDCDGCALNNVFGIKRRTTVSHAQPPFSTPPFARI